MAEKTWFITGASSGIGRRVTEILLRRGNRVAATGRRLGRLEGLAGDGDGLWTARLDVSDPAAVKSVVDRAFAELGRIDVVLSNAGHLLAGAAEEVSDQQMARQIDTNLLGPIRLARAVMPHLRHQGGGRIIQLSSEGGQAAFPGTSIYHASKWGVEGFFEALRGEVAAFGVEVTLVEPGITPTEFSDVMDLARPAEPYADGPVGRLRQFISTPGAVNSAAPSDLTKVAEAIIRSAEVSPAPLRLPLGSDAFEHLLGALTARLANHEAQRGAAHSVAAAR